MFAGLLALSCAEAGVEGLDDDDTPPTTDLDSGADANTGRRDSGSATPPRDSGASSSSGGASSGGASSGGASSGGSSSGGSSGGGSSSGTVGQPDVCSGTGSCSAASNLGQVYSDYGADVLTTSGNKSKFVSFTTYDDSGTFLTNHSYGVRFTPATGATYELRYRQCDGLDCNPCSGSGTVIPASQYQSFTQYWVDVPASGDHRTVAIEVRQISGTCPTGANWQLEVEGNVDVP